MYQKLRPPNGLGKSERIIWIQPRLDCLQAQSCSIPIVNIMCLCCAQCWAKQNTYQNRPGKKQQEKKTKNVLDITVIHRNFCARHLGRDRVHHPVDKGDAVRWVWRGRIRTRRVKLECVKGRATRERCFGAGDSIDSRVKPTPQISLAIISRQTLSKTWLKISDTNQDKPRGICCLPSTI
jgi:hypothetical protein